MQRTERALLEGGARHCRRGRGRDATATGISVSDISVLPVMTARGLQTRQLHVGSMRQFATDLQRF
jgi:hypothetical protein